MDSGRRDQRGFTLLELMISMTLLVLMIAMTYSIFATAMQSVPRGEAEAESSARLRGSTDVIARQIRSAVNYPAHSEDDPTPFPFFRGNAYYFEFVTAAPQHRGGEGLAWVRYWSDGRTLNLGERLIFSQGAISSSTDIGDQSTLIEGFNGSRFQYLRLDGTDSEWLDAWEGREEQNLPAAIRIVLDGIGDSGSEWVQEIPIMTVAYGLGSYDPDQEQQQDNSEPDNMNGPPD